MSTVTIWNPREATRAYALECMKTGHIWRRGGKFWIPTQLTDRCGVSFLVLDEVIPLKKYPLESSIVPYF